MIPETVAVIDFLWKKPWIPQEVGCISLRLSDIIPVIQKEDITMAS